MAAGDRSKKILANVRRVVDNQGSSELGVKKTVYEAIQRIQHRMAEEALNIEGKRIIETTSGQELYSLPDDFISERKLTPDGSTELKKITIDRLDELKRGLANTSETTDTTSGDVFYYYIWNGQVGFLGGSGGILTGSIDITLYYWRTPDDVVEQVSDTVDPLVPRRWDTALFYGAVAELSENDRYLQKFIIEVNRNLDRENSSRAEPLVVQNNDNYDY